MHEKQRVAVEVSTRQAGLRAERTGGTVEEIPKPGARQGLGELRDERPDHRPEPLAPDRVEERKQAQRRERDRAQREADWEQFVRTELRELELRKNGQLGRSLGEPLPGESAAALQRLAHEDRRQAEQGMVSVMKNGAVSYKHVEELSQEDMPSRVAANRSRTTWLKERRDGWIASKERRS
ncbi:hypothetical protein GBA65_17755 [Rubrobacter marinus]|uniref:Uncharacterized protein n=1 Tax=Rubrobacter marinus TaxID=2653852 RepID=A0A6G8Q0W7_9ACTN|nr:hypothetical protein [Rubrobacter marinus]QIN80060.1 hypothetical protein GBA65_17755 [Rubrobacter marinus]